MRFSSIRYASLFLATTIKQEFQFWWCKCVSAEFFANLLVSFAEMEKLALTKSAHFNRFIHGIWSTLWLTKIVYRFYSFNSSTARWLIHIKTTLSSSLVYSLVPLYVFLTKHQKLKIHFFFVHSHHKNKLSIFLLISKWNCIH